jgi:rare lipoprotein A
VLTSFYGHGERLNQRTSTGEVFNPNGLTAAHRTLPFGTQLQVTYGDKTVVVRVNDRGPASWTGRSLDLSYGAAQRLGLVARGTAFVEVAILN